MRLFLFSFLTLVSLFETANALGPVYAGSYVANTNNRVLNSEHQVSRVPRQAQRGRLFLERNLEVSSYGFYAEILSACLPDFSLCLGDRVMYEGYEAIVTRLYESRMVKLQGTAVLSGTAIVPAPYIRFIERGRQDLRKNEERRMYGRVCDRRFRVATDEVNPPVDVCARLQNSEGLPEASRASRSIAPY